MIRWPFGNKQETVQITPLRRPKILTEEQVWDKIIPNIILKGTFLSTMSFSVSGESFAIRVTPQQKLELQMYNEECFDTLNVDEKILNKIYNRLKELNTEREAMLELQRKQTAEKYKNFRSRFR